MLASRQGDERAYHTLLYRLSVRLRAYYRSGLSRLGQSGADLEDLVQESLIAIHTRRFTYDPNQPLTPWVYAIARYKLVDHFRRARVIKNALPLDEAESVRAHDDHVDAEGVHDVEKLLRRLPHKTQFAIRAVKLEGLTVGEAALRFGQTEAAVKVSVHRGLKALAALIAREKKA